MHCFKGMGKGRSNSGKEQQLRHMSNELNIKSQEASDLKARLEHMENTLSWRYIQYLEKYLQNENKVLLEQAEDKNLDKEILERFENVEQELKNSFGWLNYRIDDLVYEKILLEKKIEHNYFKGLTEDELICGLKRWYYLKLGKELDLENPITFDEKIQWMKIYDRNPLKGKLADKVKVRDYIDKKIGAQYLILVIGIYDYFDQIDFEKLLDQFILKCSHGSGWNKIVRDKSKMDIPKIKHKFDYRMSLDYAFYSEFEMHYKNMERKIWIEQYIEQLDGNLYDYKIHCFMGTPKFIQAIGDRNIYNHTAKEAFYAIYWNRLDMHLGDFPQYDEELKRPSKRDEMLTIAGKLLESFQYVRIDLYEVDNQIKFGEFTFTPNSEIHQGSSKELDYTWGYIERI